MPVKVRCSGCQKVLNAPDRARGKVLKCPHCETRVKVPAGRPQRRAAVSGPDSGDFLAGLDLSRAEDTRTRVCPKCGTEMPDPDETECPNCGYDATVGGLGKRAKKRAMRGPDPADFFPKVLPDSWEFLLNNKRWVFRTGIVWTILFMAFFNFMAFAAICKTRPPQLFWWGLAALAYLGLPGWFLVLTQEVTELTLEKKKQLKKLKSDYFATISYGIKLLAWPVVLFLLIVYPVLVAGMLILSPFEQTAFDGAVYAIAAICAFPFFPIWVAHSTQRYSYKGWLPVECLKLAVKNAGHVAVWVLISVGVNLIAFGAIVGVFFFAPTVIESLVALVENSLELAFKLAGIKIPELGIIQRIFDNESEPAGFYFWIVIWVAINILVLLIMATILFIQAIPTVFLARTTGLFAYYTQSRMEFVRMTHPNRPAGFWVRYLAYLIDALILTVSLNLIRFIFMGITLFLLKMGIGIYIIMPLNLLGLFLSLVTLVLYYVKGESGPGQGTLGKRSMGLIVVDEENRKITWQKALLRFLGRFFLPVLGWVMCVFNEDKQTLHDMMTKTYVVWRGDDPATMT